MSVEILLVDDSRLYRARLRQILEAHEDLRVVGEASNGEEAIRKTRELSPSFIVMDVMMPVMDGITAVRSILRERPIPILVLTAAERRGTFSAFDALEAGALDVMAKPSASDPAAFQALEDGLPERIRSLARIKVVRRAGEDEDVEPSRHPLFVLGASTGGPQALNTILRRLPAGFPSPVVVVQHISHGFLEGLVQWLGRECSLPVQVVAERTRLEPGHVYFAPTRQHLVVRGRNLVLDDGPEVNGCKPAADVLFRAVAGGDPGAVVGVVLTGMGQDGLEGSRALNRAGHRVLVQSPQTCAVAGMPNAVIDAQQASEVLELEGIAREMIRLSGLGE